MMKTSSRCSTILAGVVFVLFLTQCSPTTNNRTESLKKGNLELTVRVKGVEHRDGQLIGLLFRNAAGFPEGGEQADRTRLIKQIPSDDPVRMRFPDLPRGKYAVSILHDENGDRTMNRSFLGVPQEGFGMTNNPSLADGESTFEECTFRLKKNRTMTVTLNYIER